MTIITQPKTLQEFKKILDDAGVPRTEIRDSFGDLRKLITWEKAYQKYVDPSYEIFYEEDNEDEFEEVLYRGSGRHLPFALKAPGYLARPYISELIQVFNSEEITDICRRYDNLLPNSTEMIPVRANGELFIPLLLGLDEQENVLAPINRIFSCLLYTSPSPRDA